MGRVTGQNPVKLVSSVIYNREDVLKKAEESLVGAFGEIENEVKILPFDYTDYYFKEMGKPLTRKLICFRGHIEAEDSYRAKLVTNRIEEVLSVGGMLTARWM